MMNQDEKNKQYKTNDISSKNENIEDGFSSEQDSQEELLYIQPEIEKEVIIDQQKIKMKLDPIREISKKQYSLQPDMINGWAPKKQLPKPIPLTFRNYAFDSMFDFAIKVKKFDEKVQLCYLGARYQTTYYAWYHQNFQFPYQHLSAPKSIKITDRIFCGQYWHAQKPQYLQFDSFFESGNLDCVFKVADNQYDLYMRVDSNTRGHLHWYNFKVKNFQSNKNYKFNICNFQKGKSLYSRGMCPYYHSIIKQQKTGVGWQQLETKSCYKKKISKSEKYLVSETDNNSFHLSFTYTPQYKDDVIQFAYCVPYLYSQSLKLISSLEQKSLQQKHNTLKIKKLCTSLGGLDVHTIKITQNIEEQENAFENKIKLKKKIIFITGRCHPGQSNGSWMVEGLLEFLTGNSDTARFMREHVVFVIVPMLNPDGVVIGNYRTGLTGKDFNRQFTNPDKQIFPEIFFLKQLFLSYKKIYQSDAFMYLDFHGHSVKKNVFAYGPQYSIIHKNYYQSRMIPKLIAMKTDTFRYYSCIFKISEAKEKTGRAIFLRNLKIPFTYTIEASNGSYYDQVELQNKIFNPSKWKEVGQKIMEGVSDYIQLLNQLEKIKMQKIFEKTKMKQQKLKNKNSKRLSSGHSINSNRKNFGSSTSMGFRRTKISGVQNHRNEQKITLADILANGELKNEKFGILFESLKNQSEDNSQNKQSDDEISQGSSDSQGSKDDLDANQLEELIKTVKARKNKSKSVLKTEQSFLSKGEASKHTKTMYNEEGDQTYDDYSQIRQAITKKTNYKDIAMKKYFWKKKSSIGTSPSPKKQQNSSSLTPKIVTFCFDLKPVQSKISSVLKSQERKVPTFSRNQSTFYEMQSKRISSSSAKQYEFSETFKKKFMSVQKQIIKQNLQKKQQQMALGNSNKYKSPGFLIENTRGKGYA